MISWYRSSSPICLPCLAEEAPDLVEAGDEGVDLVGGGVQVDRGPGGGLDPEPAQQRLGAVVAGPDRDPVGVQHLGDVVGVDVAEGEGDHAAAGPGLGGAGGG